MTKPVILTGLRANNDLTLGNYFGGILPIIDMAKTRSSEFQINMFIPDLHSFTTPIEHSLLHDQILHNAKLFTAAGLPLDNPSIHLYRQSYVSAHSELTWILDCFTAFGEMKRMTQFKDKSEVSEAKGSALAIKYSNLYNYFNSLDKPDDDTPYYEHVDVLKSLIDKAITQEFELKTTSSVGLFNYPILMAADILLYNAQYVPVGDDQTQHLEFTRDIAERMNTRFGKLFVVPEPVKKQHEFFGKDQGLRIMDLQNPVKKMSKSDESGKGVIFLSDDPETAAKKIMSATTDDEANVQFNRERQPGISNLLEILALLRGASLKATVNEFKGLERYGDFKKIVAEEVKSFLVDFQNKLANVDEQKVLAKLESSELAMNDQASATLHNVQQAVGLRK